MRLIVAGVLLGLAVVLTLVATLALVRVPQALDRLHFATLISTPVTILLVAAVFVSEGCDQTSFATLLIGVVLIPTNAVVASATARAVLRDAGGGASSVGPPDVRSAG